MDESEIIIVEGCIKQRGDDFWTEVDEHDAEYGIVGNWHLFREVVAMLNDCGFDLKLVKLPERTGPLTDDEAYAFYTRKYEANPERHITVMKEMIAHSIAHGNQKDVEVAIRWMKDHGY